jgi:outer membrane protein assembly factor BamB
LKRQQVIPISASILLAILLAAVALDSGAASPADWPMYRNNLLHTGVAADILPPPLSLKWKQTFAGAVLSSPAIVGSRLYVGSNDFNLRAINAATGDIIWAFNPAGAAAWFSSPTVATVGGQTVIFAGNNNNILYAIRDDGAAPFLLWNTAALAGPVQSSPVVTTIAGTQVVIFGVAGAVGQVFALVAATGAVYPGWVVNPFTDLGLAGPFVSSPAILGSTAFIGSEVAGGNGRLYAINLGNGVKLWDTLTLGILPAIGANDVRSSPAIASVAGQDVVFFGADNNRLYQLVAATGVVRWSQPVGNRIRSSPAVATIPNPPVACAPGPILAVIFGSDDDNVYAMRASDGTPCWTFPSTGLQPFRSSPIVSGGTVYIGSIDDNLYAIDINTGTWQWSFPAIAQIGDPAGIVAPNPVISGSTLYFGTNAPDNKLYAFQPAISVATSTSTNIISTSTTTTVPVTQTTTMTTTTATVSTGTTQTMTTTLTQTLTSITTVISTTTTSPGIPGFPIESILIGLVGGLVALTLLGRKRRRH